MSTRGEVLKALKGCKDLRDHGCIPSDLGICLYVVSITGFDPSTVGDVLKPVFRKWPKYSGNDWYPVPHPEYSLEDYEFEERGEYWAEMAFEEEFVRDMWTGPYGKLRDELLSFCIEQLEKELKL